MDETFAVFHRVLSFAGIQFFEKSNRKSKRVLYFQVFNVFIGFVTFIFTTLFVITNIDDTLLLIQGACIWTTGVILFITLIICFVFRDKFRDFLDEMGFKDGILEMPFIEYVLKNGKSNKMRELKYLVISSQEKLLKITRILLKTYVASVWLCTTLYLMGPIYLMFVRGDESLRLLAFDMWFPWSLENFKVYVASFIFHAYAGYLCCIGYPGLQTTLVLLVGQIVRQLRILTFILLNLNELVSEIFAEKDERWYFYCSVIFTQTVDHYIKIKRFSNRLNVICQPFYLALILVAIMLVCVCSVKIAISDKTSPDTMKYYVHEFCFILVVLMFCLLGQQVENETQKLAEAATKDWYIFDRRYKVNLKIFQMALGQRMPIYIFGSIKLELPTFTWFIKTGMSFFTLVMSVLEEQ